LGLAGRCRIRFGQPSRPDVVRFIPRNAFLRRGPRAPPQQGGRGKRGTGATLLAML